MTSWERNRDIENVIHSGIRDLICEHVKAGNAGTAKSIADQETALADRIRTRLNVAFSIKRPRKRNV